MKQTSKPEKDWKWCQLTPHESDGEYVVFAFNERKAMFIAAILAILAMIYCVAQHYRTESVATSATEQVR